MWPDRRLCDSSKSVRFDVEKDVSLNAIAMPLPEAWKDTRDGSVYTHSGIPPSTFRISSYKGWVEKVDKR